MARRGSRRLDSALGRRRAVGGDRPSGGGETWRPAGGAQPARCPSGTATDARPLPDPARRGWPRERARGGAGPRRVSRPRRDGASGDSGPNRAGIGRAACDNPCDREPRDREPRDREPRDREPRDRDDAERPLPRRRDRPQGSPAAADGPLGDRDRGRGAARPGRDLQPDARGHDRLPCDLRRGGPGRWQPGGRPAAGRDRQPGADRRRHRHRRAFGSGSPRLGRGRRLERGVHHPAGVHRCRRIRSSGQPRAGRRPRRQPCRRDRPVPGRPVRQRRRDPSSSPSPRRHRCRAGRSMPPRGPGLPARPPPLRPRSRSRTRTRRSGS